MSVQVMKVMVPPAVGEPRIAALISAIAAFLQPRDTRAGDLLQLASEVEAEQPGLACELRGIAMHEAAATPPPPVPLESRWRRAGLRVWRSLEEIGRARAERNLLELADRWESTQPALAKDLRAACRRTD